MMGAVVVGTAIGLVGSSGLFIYDYVDGYAREHYDVDEDDWVMYTGGVVFLTFLLCYITFQAGIEWWYYS